MPYTIYMYDVYGRLEVDYHATYEIEYLREADYAVMDAIDEWEHYDGPCCCWECEYEQLEYGHDIRYK